MPADSRAEAAAALRELRESARAWLTRLEWPDELWPPVTLEGREWAGLYAAGLRFTCAYSDLAFAFGLARVGDASASAALAQQARPVLEGVNGAHTFLLGAYTYRIRQAREGQAHQGPLPTSLMRRLDENTLQRIRDTEKRGAGPTYVIDRLRSLSSILEPDQRVDPYRHANAFASPDFAGACSLCDIDEPAELASRIRPRVERLCDAGMGELDAIGIAAICIDAAPRVSEEFARWVLAQVPGMYDSLPERSGSAAREARAWLLERGIFHAARCDDGETLVALLDRAQVLFRGVSGLDPCHSFPSLLAVCVRGLRKTKGHDVLRQLLSTMPPAASEGTDPLFGSGLTQLLLELHSARGWLALREVARAEPALATTRAFLWRANTSPPSEIARKMNGQTRLACAYAEALGGAPIDQARELLGELFERMPPPYDTFTTADHYSQLRLQVVEAVVWALCNREEVLGDVPVY
jgi:hypothetical protein